LGRSASQRAKHYLLLVAAGQVDDELLGARHADVERAAEVVDQLVFGGLVVLGHKSNAMADGLLRRANVDGLAIDQDAPGVEGVGAEYRSRHFRAAGSDQPGNPQDLATTHGPGESPQCSQRGQSHMRVAPAYPV